MLKNLFQSREEKNRERIEIHISEGMRHLTSKFFNGAMMAFDKAMELNPEEVYPRLVTELSNAAISGNLEAALAIGMNLIKQDGQDFELANKLGNYARELKDYKQANALYKTALKINRRYELAFYNLAASQAKADIFDEAVKSSLAQFDKVDDYILPDYIGNDKIIEEMSTRIQDTQRANTHLKIEELTVRHNEKNDAGFAIEAEGIKLTIDKLKKESNTITQKDLLRDFLIQVKKDPENQKSHRFNMSIYALSEKISDAAIKSLNELKNEDFETIRLLKAIAAAQQGRLDDAIYQLIQLLTENPYNRYNNVNLGLMYRKAGQHFLSIKYLVKTAHLLGKSCGRYSMKALVEEANKLVKKGQSKSALEYYQLASTEIPSADLWHKIGTILVERKQYEDAVVAFKETQKLDPQTEAAQTELQEIHDYYVDKGNQLFDERKFKPAVEYFNKALGVYLAPDTLKKGAAAYKQLNDPENEKILLKKCQRIIDEEKARDLELHRQKLIEKGKLYIQTRKFNPAIEALESAFRLKIDQAVFLQLATLYKGLKKRDQLEDLEDRWEKMHALEEKMKKIEKEEQRNLHYEQETPSPA